MGLILPTLLVVAGLGAGVGAGIAFRPDAKEHLDSSENCVPAETPVKAAPPEAPAPPTEFVKLNNQFMVPVLSDGDVQSMVVLSLSIEVAEGSKEAIYQREPKLRDAFLRVMFDHANAGGFDGNFLNSSGLDALRMALTETARGLIGPLASDVLIVDLVKQEV